nr:unnamed protein product [Digitaria exilis]
MVEEDGEAGSLPLEELVPLLRRSCGRPHAPLGGGLMGRHPFALYIARQQWPKKLGRIAEQGCRESGNTVQDRKQRQPSMEVEAPQAAAAAVAAALLKCRGDGGEARVEASGKAVSRSPSREAQELDGCPGTGGHRGQQEEEEEEEGEPLRRGLAAAQARARARRKAGHATPSPSWKLEPSPPLPEEAASASAEADTGAGRRGPPAASARQLGATLWEIQDVIRVAGAGRRIRHRGRRAPAVDEASADADRMLKFPLTFQPRSSGGFRAYVTASVEHGKLHEERCTSRQPLSPASYTSSVGACIKELMQERQRYHHEIDSLARQVTEDKMARRNKEQEKIKAALHSLQQELEDERRLRKHSETLHRKLGKELSETKSAFCKAVKALEKEKKTINLLEDLCDEFAKGIRKYEEEVRMLKQKHVKEYEHKFDKSVVHISEAWLDERMQMQKTDRREDLVGKTSITERLSSEIESFVHHAKGFINSKNDNIDICNEKRDASFCRQSLESVHLNGATSAPRLAEDDDGSSIASDLHCFELNMHGGAFKSHDLAVAGSPMSNAPTCSKKEKARVAVASRDVKVVRVRVAVTEADGGSPYPWVVAVSGGMEVGGQ